MGAVFHGVGINFGIAGGIVGVNGLFQTRDHNFSADSQLIEDGSETPVSKVFWKFKEEATFIYVAAAPGYWPYGNAPVQYPIIGEWITVLDTNYPDIVGQWLTDDVTISNSNTTAVRVAVKLSRYPYVTQI